jgi:hypothetical protein
VRRPGLLAVLCVPGALAAIGSVGACRDEPAPPRPAPSASGSALPPVVELPSGKPALTTAQAERLLPAGTPALVELVDAGAEPRAKLAYAATGRSGTLVVDATVNVKISEHEADRAEPVPPLRVTLAFKDPVGVPAPDGAAELEIRAVTTLPRNEAERARAGEMAPLLERLRASKLGWRFTDTGLAWQPPSLPSIGTDLEVIQIWQPVAEALEDMVVPFPPDAVGKGASWRVLDRRRRGGMAMLRMSSYRLLATDPLTVDAVVAEAALADPGPDPAMPPEVKLTVHAGHGTGSRRLVWAGAAADVPASSRTTLELGGSFTARADIPGAEGVPGERTLFHLDEELRVERGEGDGR